MVLKVNPVRIRMMLVMLPAVVFAVWPAIVQAGKSKGKADFPLEYLNVEQILDVVVGNIASRYNLNEAQTEYTDELMKREVQKFLRDHSDSVWPVIRELVTGQRVGQPPEDPEELSRLGKAARPLAELAEEVIFKANEEWRNILSDKQKRMHDFDLNEMRKQFDGIHENLESWESGQPLRRNIFPPPEKYKNEPPKPPRPAAGIPGAKPDLPPDKHKGKVTLNADMFATYVEEFIKDYELDPGQVNSARSILKEFQGRAQSYLDANKESLERTDAQQEAAVKKRDHKAIAEADAAHRELLEPVNELFQKMDDRLQGLLTSAQKDRKVQQGKSPKSSPKGTPTKKKTSHKKKGSKKE